MLLETSAGMSELDLVSLHESANERKMRGDQSGARDIYRAALQAQPQDRDIRVGLAEALMALEELEDAVLCWKGYFDDGMGPVPIGVHIRLATAYQRQHLYGEAELVLENCLRLHPSYRPASELLERIRSERSALYAVKAIALTGDQTARLLLPEGYVKFGSLGEAAVSIEAPADMKVSHLLIRRRNGREEQIMLSPTSGGEGRQELTVNLYGAETVGLLVAQQPLWLWTIGFEKLEQVVMGAEGWLFLGNDSNRSIELYRGTLLASDADLQGWDRYFAQVGPLMQRHNGVMLIAPAKEKVVPQFYPHERGAITLMDQIQALEGYRAVDALYPLELLRTPDAYPKVDTHWTEYGAFLALKLCLERWGIDIDLDAIFTFGDFQSAGDLGSKFTPQIMGNRRQMQGVAHGQSATFDFYNGIDTAGSVQTFSNRHAPVPGKLLIFGDSFITALMPMARNLFGQVVRHYSPAAPILSVVEDEQPDFLLLQSNERFLLRPAGIYATLEDSPLAHKLAVSDAAERDRLLRTINSKPADNIYSRFMRTRLESENVR